MRKIIIIGLTLAVAACSGWGKKELGIANISPDETVVESRKPLSLPPEFDVRPNIKAEVNE